MKYLIFLLLVFSSCTKNDAVNLKSETDNKLRDAERKVALLQDSIKRLNSPKKETKSESQLTLKSLEYLYDKPLSAVLNKLGKPDKTKEEVDVIFLYYYDKVYDKISDKKNDLSIVLHNNHVTSIGTN